MGTDYSLGIITKFSATSNTELTGEEWLNVLNERIDVSLFDLETAEKEAMGALQKDVFRENITGFYDVLRKILGANRNGNIDYYERDFGTELDNYQFWRTPLKLQKENGISIQFDLTMALLFIEGKVMAEIFNSDPVLINWLFRNSNIDNKLAGCVISSIVG